MEHHEGVSYYIIFILQIMLNCDAELYLSLLMYFQYKSSSLIFCNWSVLLEACGEIISDDFFILKKKGNGDTFCLISIWGWFFLKKIVEVFKHGIQRWNKTM